MDLEAARTRLFVALGSELRDKKILQVMERIPREAFIPPSRRHAAYDHESGEQGHGTDPVPPADVGTVAGDHASWRLVPDAEAGAGTPGSVDRVLDVP